MTDEELLDDDAYDSDDGLVDRHGNRLGAGPSAESAEEKAARYRSRPDAAQVQAETQRVGARAGKGLKCPKCHCQNFRVLETRPGEDSKTRRRICRACGYVFRTCEFVTSDLPPDSILEAMVRRLQQ